MEKQEQIEAYWQKKRQEIGEEILFKSVAQGYQRRQPERIGILFLTESYLVFEYSTGTQKSILETLLGRSRGEELNQIIRIPRREIKMAKLLSLRLSKRWLRRGNSALEVLSLGKAHDPSLLNRLLADTCLGVCTVDSFLAFSTPVDRIWAQRLNPAAGPPARG